MRFINHYSNLSCALVFRMCNMLQEDLVHYLMSKTIIEWCLLSNNWNTLDQIQRQIQHTVRITQSEYSHE